MGRTFFGNTTGGSGGGTVGPPGPPGPPGPVGHIQWQGQGPPGNIPGAQPGQTYLDTLTGDIYKLS